MNIPRDQDCNFERCPHEEKGDNTAVEEKPTFLYTMQRASTVWPPVKNTNHGTKVEEKVLNVLL